ncbi:hypothetical protein [Nonomuraea insulae]|uniref:Uncharacterized protein n=1 Tax=Nonomuraea insulae TaxID=1616787 RepID=A0ABW1CTN4_9ACTN
MPKHHRVITTPVLQPARVLLGPAPTRDGVFDDAWWPCSTDLDREILLRCHSPALARAPA